MSLRANRSWALLVATAAALFALASPALAEVRSGHATDPEESERLPAGRDILAVDASYDTAGTIRAAVTLAGPPTTPDTGLGAVFYPVDSDGDCVAPAAAVATEYDSEAEWAYDGSGGIAQKAVSGTTVSLSATAAALANQPFACANAVVSNASGPEWEEIEYLIPAIKLVAPPAPPPPPPSPPPPPPLRAKLALTAPKSLTLRRKVWAKAKLKLGNRGNATATGLKLKVGGARGVKIRPASRRVKLKAIAPGKARAAGFRVLLTRKAKATSRIRVTVTGKGGLKASAKLTLKLKRKKRRGRPTERPPRGSGSLAQSIFYGYTPVSSYESADLIGFAFVDRTWAYTGIPSGGLPRCTEVTGNTRTPGCARYTYDPRSGAVKIGALHGRLKGDTLEIDGESLSRLAVPKPGTRLQVSQYYMSFYGMCGSFTGCTTTRQDLTLTRDGQFGLSASSTTTSGVTGGNFIAIGSYPPEERGTYEIQPRARIRLAFADGTVEVKTIAIMLDQRGRPDPAGEGLILDGIYFTFAGDD